MSETIVIDPPSVLLTLGMPESFDFPDWPDYPAEYGFDASHIPALIAIATDTVLIGAGEDNPKSWAPMLAWRVLGQLRAEAAVMPLLDLLKQQEYHEGLSEDLPHVFGLIGAPAIPSVVAALHDPATHGMSAAVASDTLSKIGQQHPGLRGECVARLTGILNPETINSIATKTWALSALLDLRAVDSIETIREAFARGDFDLSICGDLEEVEIALGLRTERETPRPRFASNVLDMPSWRRTSIENGDDDDPDEIAVEPIRTGPKVGRNEPCPCGSGKKHKKCCLV